MGNIFGIVIVRPLGLILMALYSLIKNYGWAVIAFTIIVKLILLPFMYHQKKSMKKMSKVQAEAQEIQKRYAKNREKAQEEVSKLYEREGVNPMSGCLLSFITLPIMMALYYAVRKPMTFMMGLGDDTIMKVAQMLGQTYDPKSINGQIELAKMVHENWDKVSSFADQGLVNIDFNFLGILDLSAVPHWTQLNVLWLIPILSGVTALLSSLIMQKMQKKQNPGQEDNPMMNQMNTMMLMMPLMSVWIAFSLPASMGLYWIVNNVFTLLQELFLTKLVIKANEKDEAIASAERAKEEAAHQKALDERREQQRAAAKQQNESSKKKKKK